MEYIEYLIENEKENEADMPVETPVENCIKADVNDIWDYHRKTVLYGKSECFVPMKYFTDGKDMRVFYNEKGLVSLEEYLSEKIHDFEDFLDMISGVIHCIMETKHYLMAEEELIITAKTLFTDKKAENWFIRYEPGKSGGKSGFSALKEIIRRFVYETDMDDTLKSEILNYLAVATSGCRNLKELKKFTLQYGTSYMSRKEAAEEMQIAPKPVKKKRNSDFKLTIKKLLIKLIT